MSKKPIVVSLGIALVTLISGTTVIAASSYVKAFLKQSNVILNGQTLSNPAVLEYNHTTYMPLYNVQQSLNALRITNHWDGRNFTLQTHQSNEGTGAGGVVGPPTGLNNDTDITQQMEQSVLGVRATSAQINLYLNGNQDSLTLGIVGNALLASSVGTEFATYHSTDSKLQGLLQNYIAILNRYHDEYNSLYGDVEKNDINGIIKIQQSILGTDSNFVNWEKSFFSYVNQ